MPTIHQINKKRRCLHLFQKLSSFKGLDIQLLQEFTSFEIEIADKKFNFISWHRSPSQSKDEFESLPDNLELNLDSTALRYYTWLVFLVTLMHKKRMDLLGKTNYEDTRIDGITFQFGLE